jgi:hypothetical protein
MNKKVFCGNVYYIYFLKFKDSIMNPTNTERRGKRRGAWEYVEG